jgi:hypothetical protein
MKTITVAKRENRGSENNYTLIDGTFSAHDATKILLDIINNKINYHHLHVFSIKERFNGDVSHSEKRIKELIKISNSLKKSLADAAKKGLRVEIHCPIEIKLIE